MNREEIFTKAIFSEVSSRKCAVSMETLPNGQIKLHGHIYLRMNGKECEKLYCQSANDMVEIAAVKASDMDWLAEYGLKTIPNYFSQFQGDNIVPVMMWKYDWSIIHVKMEDFLEAIDAILE